MNSFSSRASIIMDLPISHGPVSLGVNTQPTEEEMPCIPLSDICEETPFFAFCHLLSLILPCVHTIGFVLKEKPKKGLFFFPTMQALI
jgi:hypothetical protein